MSSKLPRGAFNSGDISAYRIIVGERLPVGGTLVEVGSWVGRSICSVASEILEREATVYCVDDFSQEGIYEVDKIRAAREELRAEFLHNLSRFGIASRVTLVETPSPAAAALVPEADVVFIDGCHEREAVRADVLAWRAVRGVRLLCGHDYLKAGGSPMYRGVRETLHEVLGKEAVYKISQDEAPMNKVWLCDV